MTFENSSNIETRETTPFNLPTRLMTLEMEVLLGVCGFVVNV